MPVWAPLVTLAIVLALMIVHAASAAARAWVWKALAVLGTGMVAVVVYYGLGYAPPEAYMSDVGRIIYVHIPFVWVCMLAFSVNVVCAVGYLFKQGWRLDALAEASAEVGIFFGAAGVMTGSIWARPTWGVWWDWDPRLISTTVMLLVYVGYLAFRAFTEDPDRRATWSAAGVILGYVTLPITWFSVQWWNSLHQRQGGALTVDPAMRVGYLFSTVAFIALFFVFTFKRYEIARSQQTSALELPLLEAPKQVSA
jgi:heme exporter protein C